MAEGLVGPDITLTGVLDNIPADNPISDGSLALGPTTGNLTLDGGTIDQGTVTTSGANDLVATGTGGTLYGVTLDGTLDMSQSYGATVNVLDSLTLNGLIELGGATGPAYLTFGGDNDNVAQSIDGTGTIRFGQNYDNLLDLSNAPLMFGPTITLQAGADSYIDSYASIVNQGTLEENASGGTLVIAAPNGFTNSGTVTIGAGATLSVAAGIVNGVASGSSGDYTQSGGTTTVDGTLNAELSISTAVCSTASAPITADLTNAGTVSPGDGPTPRALTVGSYTQTAAGILDINIAGTNSVGQIVGGSDVGGTLNIALVNGFVPQAGDSFPILGTSAATLLPQSTCQVSAMAIPSRRFVNGNGGLTLLVTPPAPPQSPPFTGPATPATATGTIRATGPPSIRRSTTFPRNVIPRRSGQRGHRPQRADHRPFRRRYHSQPDGHGSEGDSQPRRGHARSLRQRFAGNVPGRSARRQRRAGRQHPPQRHDKREHGDQREFQLPEPRALDDCVIDGTVDVAAYSVLDLTGRWTNKGTIIANAGSTLGLGSPISIAPPIRRPPITNGPTRARSPSIPRATVEVGGVMTTDAFNGLLPALGRAQILYSGSLDNSKTDNPVSGGTFDLDSLPSGLTFFGGLVYEGLITSADNSAIDGGYSTGGGRLPVDVTLVSVTLDGVLF